MNRESAQSSWFEFCEKLDFERPSLKKCSLNSLYFPLLEREQDDNLYAHARYPRGNQHQQQPPTKKYCVVVKGRFLRFISCVTSLRRRLAFVVIVNHYSALFPIPPPPPFSNPAPLYFVFPQLIGMYLFLLMKEES